MKQLLILGFLVGLGTQPAFSEPLDEAGDEFAPPVPELSANAPTPAFSPKFTGMIELRPSWNPAGNDFHTENTLDLGYNFSPNFSMDYNQYINTNLSKANTAGIGVDPQDGFLRARFKNVWQNVKKDLTIEIEERLYMPTQASKRDVGMIVALRNYMTVIKQFTPKFSLIVQEIPIIYGFDRSGTTKVEPPAKVGDPAKVTHTPNAAFENRLYLIASYDITPTVNFSFPLMLWATAQRRFGPTAVSPSASRWAYMAMIWPELNVAVGPQTFVGVSYYSGNFLDGFKKGLSDGVTQLILRQTL